MKKIIFGLLATSLLVSFAPAESKAASTNEPITAVEAKPEATEEAKALLLRLDVINALDKKDMKSPQKKELRKEVRSIKQQLAEISDGLYLSVGAIIIILLLVIILL